jgi:hypothetical protein
VQATRVHPDCRRGLSRRETGLRLQASVENLFDAYCVLDADSDTNNLTQQSDGAGDDVLNGMRASY